MTIAVKAFLIANPAAGGRFHREALEEAMAHLRRNGAALYLEHTQGPGQAVDLARQAASQGYDLVVACGGDGTVNEVANGLAGSHVPMGVLPLGTVNIWATEAGIPRSPREAARVLLEGDVGTVDVGLAGRRYFLLMAGIGLDGAVARNLSLPMKKLLGRGAYVLAGAWTAAGFEGARVDILVDGRRLERQVVWIVVGNTRLYGGLLEVTPHARVDDGMLDLCIFSGRGFLSSTGHLMAVVGRRHLSLEGVEYLRCKEVSIESQTPLPIQADGDPIGHTPQNFRIAAGALRVVLPPGRRGSIFTQSSGVDLVANKAV